MAATEFHAFALAAAPAAAAVANYCDHVEHNEFADVSAVLLAAERLTELAFDLAEKREIDLLSAYADRLSEIESRNVVWHSGRYDGAAAARAAATWRDLQLVQIEHDRNYHADVIGLAKCDQLRHYALHLAKIIGAFAEAADPDSLLRRRLPDTLLFSLKLNTVMGRRLTDELIPRMHTTAFAASASSV